MQQVREREDKFEVPADWVMPDGLPPLKDASMAEEIRMLDSTYFDTPTGSLRQFGITLRRRVGDEGTGWQLKVPNGSARIEMQSGSSAKTVPGELAKAIAALRNGEDLVQVARMSTTRRVRRVLDGDGELAVEIADDSVRSTSGDSRPEQSWREIEVEVGPAGGKKALRKTGKWLFAAGAAPSASANKVDRALRNGQAAPDTLGKPQTLGALIEPYLATQCDVIACNDIGLRTGQQLVHKTRVAVRRLRSVLRICADLFDPGKAAEFDGELVWFADLLGRVRDCDVLDERLTDRIDELPAEYVLGPVRAEMEKTLASQRREAWDNLRQEMDGERYASFLKLLRVWRSTPPLTAAADVKPKRVQAYVDKAKRKADKRFRKADGDPGALHRARKSAKRMRYVAELAEPNDSDFASIVKKGKARQSTLGDHQDAVVAADFLRQLGAAAGANGHNGFTYGLLMANELNHAAAIRAGNEP
jgi:CHAD domain-containing protein